VSRGSTHQSDPEPHGASYATDFYQICLGVPQLDIISHWREQSILAYLAAALRSPFIPHSRCFSGATASICFPRLLAGISMTFSTLFFSLVATTPLKSIICEGVTPSIVPGFTR
jgi:hypothetical protein